MQFSRVEISSVNTSQLKVLKESENAELLKKTKEGNKKARDALISGNLRLVLSVVQRFSGRNENPDDLFQVGCVGLIKAVDNFDLTQQVRFSTYAVPMIIGEIRRFLRDNNAVRVSRSLRDVAYHAMQVREDLQASCTKEPTVEEIAKEMGINVRQVVIALEAVVDPISLYEPVYSDGGDTIYVVDQVGDTNCEQDWIDEMNIKDEIEKLSEREREILHKRFMLGKTQIDVAGEIGISQAQVSRLEKGALSKLTGS